MENLALKMTLKDAVASGTILQEDQQYIETMVEQDNSEEALKVLQDWRNYWAKSVNTASSTYLDGIQGKQNLEKKDLNKAIKKAAASSVHIMGILRLEEQIRIRNGAWQNYEWFQ
ncbi:MAG: hypothetical protein HQM14_19710 [SAR324 cluster bacterium]|nr:hypothetical protein [SAR324 cluster bacterium]